MAACSNGMRVPRRTTPSASVALSSPASRPSSSSRGKKTGATRGADRVAAVQVQRRALARWPNPASLPPARLQLATTRRAARSLTSRVSCQIGRRAGLHHFAQGLRLQLLHRFKDRRLDLRQGGFRVASPPLRQFPRDSLARGLPPRQDLLDLVLARSIPSATVSAGRSVTLPDYAKLRRAPIAGSTFAVQPRLATMRWQPSLTKMMRRWLEVRGQVAPDDHANHVPGAPMMPGMLSPEELALLAAAKGKLAVQRATTR